MHCVGVNAADRKDAGAGLARLEKTCGHSSGDGRSFPALRISVCTTEVTDDSIVKSKSRDDKPRDPCPIHFLKSTDCPSDTAAAGVANDSAPSIATHWFVADFR